MEAAKDTSGDGHRLEELSADSTDKLRLPRGWMKFKVWLLKIQSERSIAPVGDEQPASSWRPFYLRRRVLGAFAILFPTLIVCLETLLAQSNKNQGLAMSTDNLHYLWTFGPTLFLTVVATLWSRVEYQTQVSAPWVRLSRGFSSAGETLLLDYASSWQLPAISKAIRNGDFAIVLSITVSLLLRTSIVLSTSLITLSLIGVVDPSFPVSLRNQFVDDASSLLADTQDTLPGLYMSGLINNNLTYTDGISDVFAYQSISANVSDTTELNVTVDAFSAGLSCNPATLQLVNTTMGNVNFLVDSPGCEVGLVTLPSILEEESIVEDNTVQSYIFSMQNVFCGKSAALEDSRLFFAFVSVNFWNIRTGNPTAYTTTPNSTRFVCQPTYGISRVDISRNGTAAKSISPLDNSSSRTLSNVDPAQIMLASSEYFNGANGMEGGVDFFCNFLNGVHCSVYGTKIYVDMGAIGAIMFQGKSLLHLDSWCEPGYLQNMVTQYYQQFTAILAHMFLMEPADIPSIATIVSLEDRLLVRPLTVQLMTVLFALSTMAVVGMLFLVPTKAILPRNPSSILDISALFADSSDVLASLPTLTGLEPDSKSNSEFSLYRPYVRRGQEGHAPRFRIATAGLDPFITGKPWNPPRNRSINAAPVVFSPVIRFSISLVIIGFIIALEITLRESLLNTGLGDVGDDTYLHYTWTFLPTAVMSCLALYLAAVDSNVRELAPYINLRKGGSLGRTIGLSLLDKTTLSVLVQEVRARVLVAVLSTASVLIASLLTIFSGSLFLAQSVPAVTVMQLATTQSFEQLMTSNDTHRDTVLGSLILELNLSYPAFTYEDLAFPTFSLLPNAANANAMLPWLATIVATVPALRARLDCRQDVPPSVNLNMLELGLTAELCSGTVIFPTYTSTVPSVIFGQAMPSVFSSNCSSDWTFFWGTYSSSGQNLWVLNCNETSEVVQVQTTFLAPDLGISVSSPPVPIAGSNFSARVNKSLPMANIDFYYALNITSGPRSALDGAFTQLTTSRYAIPLSYLEDPSHVQDVAAALQFQHQLIRAQTYSLYGRVPANATNVTLPYEPASLAQGNDAVNYTANVTNPLGRRRVVQDPSATRLLQALLAALLVLGLGGWAMLRVPDVVPCSPTSVAGAAALVAQGNLMEWLAEGKGAAWMGEAELRASFVDRQKTFWLGRRDGDAEGKVAIWVLENL